MKQEKITFVEEFKTFILRGNVIDLAVGIIVGAAFTTIVNSLVKDIIMPPISILLGRVNIADQKFVLQQSYTDAQGKMISEVAIQYGSFLQNVLNFLIIAIIIFAMVKLLALLRKSENTEKTKTTKKKS